MTGHLDELDPSGESKQCLEQGWTPDKTAIPEMAVRDPKDLFPYPVNDNEVLPYWTDGMIRLGYVLDDDFLLRRAKKHYDVIVDKVDKDSVLFMWWVHRHDQALLNAGQGRADVVPRAGRHLQRPPVVLVPGRRRAGGVLCRLGPTARAAALETAYSGERRWTAGSSCWANAFPAFETYTWSGNPEIRGILTGLFRQCRIDRPNVEGTYLGSEKFPGRSAIACASTRRPAPGRSAICGRKRGQAPFVRSTRRAVPAKGACPLFLPSSTRRASGWTLWIATRCSRSASTWATNTSA